MKIVRDGRYFVITDIESGDNREQEIAIGYTGDSCVVNAITLDNVVLPVLAASAMMLHALKEVEKHNESIKKEYQLPESLMRVVRNAIAATVPTL